MMNVAFYVANYLLHVIVVSVSLSYLSYLSINIFIQMFIYPSVFLSCNVVCLYSLYTVPYIYIHIHSLPRNIINDTGKIPQVIGESDH